MPKPVETPEQLTGKDKVELAAEPTAKSIQDMIKGAVSEAVGQVKAEMLEEANAKAREAAEKTLEGKEAASCDSENIYGKDFVAMFRAMAKGASVEEANAEVSPARALGKAAMYLLGADGNRSMAAEKMAKDGMKGKELDIAEKALGIHDFTSGGALLQGDMFDEVVPELLSETALISDGSIPRFPTAGQLSIPYESTGPTTRHVEENAAANASESSFEQLVLTPKQATVIVPASKTMLTSVARGAEVVERSMRRSLAVDVDNELIRGTGASSTPTGLRYLANTDNLMEVNSPTSAQNTVFDLLRLQEAVQNSNVPWSPAVGRYAFSPRTWRYLTSLRDSDGYIFQQEMMRGSLLGITIAGQSGRGISSIPENLAVTSTSESEVYFYTTDGLIMAIGEDLRLEMSDSAAYNNSAGTVVSAFSRDQVVWKLVFKYDFGSIYRGHNIAALIDVGWGVA